MMRSTAALIVSLVAATLLAGEPKANRPVGDDSTDQAPLDHTARPLPNDNNNLAPGSADQGGGVPDAAKQDGKRK